MTPIAECSKAEIEFRSQGGWLELKMRDNGKGFDPSHSFEGQGLLSMVRRAERLGGTMEVVSGNGEGTAVTMRTPLG
jgi:signal transduction histidine kinase